MSRKEQAKEGFSILGMLVLLVFPLWILLIFAKGFFKKGED